MANVRSIQTEPGGLEWQADLFAAAEPLGFDRSFAGIRRSVLSTGAWIDHVERWVRGSDELLVRLGAELPWERHTVTMYDRLVDEPRLTQFRVHDHLECFPEIAAMSAALSVRYQRDLCRVGAALYRDGNDSVAWHGDRFDAAMVDPMVAIVSFGAARQLRVRPRGGGPSIGFVLHPGDLIVLGGTIHRSHEHCIPKTRRRVGARVSVMFREPSSIAP
jgi:alkylated DNA repair dioxygenase AlkB